MATSEAQSKSTIFQAQTKVAELLNACPDLSATPFWPEDMLDIESQVREALLKQGIACMVMTPRLDYQGRCGESTAWDMNALELLAVENPQVNRARQDATTALDVVYKAVEWLAGPDSPTRGMFTPVTIRQGEEQKRVVVTAELKALLHDEEEKPPAFPDRQVMVFSDGSVMPIRYASSPEQVDMTINEPYTGLNRDMMVELAMYGSVGMDAFAACANLKRVYIDSAAQQVGEGSFRQCGSLETLYFGGRTLAQVQAMDGYPFGIEDTSVISAEL